MEDGIPDSGIINKLIFTNDDGVALKIHSEFKLNVDDVSGGTYIEFALGALVTLQLKNTRYIITT